MAVVEYEKTVETEPKEDLSVFRRAADLIDEMDWCQGVFARDEYGSSTEVLDRYARSFCIYGALYRVTKGSSAVHKPWCLSLGFEDSKAVEDWNDAEGRTKSEVVERLRRAAEGEFVP